MLSRRGQAFAGGDARVVRSAPVPIYFDYNATTPLDPAARESMLPLLDATWGNPSSVHSIGRAARAALDEARYRLASLWRCKPSEVVFTGGGTESNNLAILGTARLLRERGRHLICSAVEHPAVLHAFRFLRAHEGFELTELPVDAAGRVSVSTVAAALRPDTTLVSVMAANNEVGTIQPLADIVELARPHGIPVHSDGVQAIGVLDLEFASSGLDALSVSSHKVGGPLGVGALVAARGLTLEPLLHGGSQERSRSGTLDVPGIAGFAAALSATDERRLDTVGRVSALRDALVDGVRREIPDAVFTGDPRSQGRLPGNAHFSFPGCEGDALLMLLDARGVECSTGSACTAGIPEPSHVLLAMGVDPELARGSLRFSLGSASTIADVDAVLDALPSAVARARRAGQPRVRPSA